MFTVLGYGKGEQPFNQGVVMATTMDASYANDIVTSLAFRYVGQWFGLKLPDNTFSKPVRVKVEETTW